ncbi:hypothetical protein INR49_005144 [Caranx melampygus]|nr:hypothetical protein INR49_005144 [Caranx melampygus]
MLFIMVVLLSHLLPVLQGHEQSGFCFSGPEGEAAAAGRRESCEHRPLSSLNGLHLSEPDALCCCCCCCCCSRRCGHNLKIITAHHYCLSLLFFFFFFLSSSFSSSLLLVLLALLQLLREELTALCYAFFCRHELVLDLRSFQSGCVVS